MAIISNPKKRILLELYRHTCHGYALSKKLDLPLASIYEHLKELREKDLITCVEMDRRKNYQLTEKGKLLIKVIE